MQMHKGAVITDTHRGTERHNTTGTERRQHIETEAQIFGETSKAYIQTDK